LDAEVPQKACQLVDFFFQVGVGEGSARGVGMVGLPVEGDSIRGMAGMAPHGIVGGIQEAILVPANLYTGSLRGASRRLNL
jgi:hypothetical protein